MREVTWSLTALMLAAGGCGSSDPVGSDPTEQSNENASSRDGGGSKRDGGSSSASRDGGLAKDGGKGGGSTVDDGCRSAFTTGQAIPDMLIVLDRSGSMKPTDGTVRCDNADVLTSITCGLLGIDCNNPAYKNTSNCGGPGGPVDRWTPSVNAIDGLTKQFDQQVAFGLMTFPSKSDSCGPGDFQVEIDTGTSDKISSILRATQPGGGTPTGETLQAALDYFKKNGVAADTVKPAQYVLLVTDGQPTCPNSNGSTGNQTKLKQDKDFTLAAIDELTKAGVKTFVVGYDANLDQSLADALKEFAQHGGTDDYYPVQNEDSLNAAFSKISEVVSTCAFDFKKEITDPALLHVSLDGVTLKPDDANGFLLDGQTVTVQGESCDKLKIVGANHHVEIALECTPVVY